MQVFDIIKKFFTTLTLRFSGADKEKLPPQAATSSEILALKEKMANSIDEIRNKSSALTVQELKRLLFRCAATLIAMQKVCDIIVKDPSQYFQSDYDLLHYLVALPFEVSTPSAIAAGIEVWTWVIAENPDIEVALMSELLAAWSDTIRLEKGIFSDSMK